MGSSNGKCRRPNGVLKGEDGCSPLYALCGTKPTSVLYSKSLENCSLKLYRVDGENERDDVVVMLDCGGRVYANGKKVYPFDHDNASNSSKEELNASRVIGELTNDRIPDVFGKGGVLEKHLSPGDYAGALDSLLNIMGETFNELLFDGLKMQESMRILEEEKTGLSLKVLELKKEQLHSQKLELEKKKLELRVEELETSLSLQSGMLGGMGMRPSYNKSATLSRSSSIGVGEGRHGGFMVQRKVTKSGSLRRDGSLPSAGDADEPTRNGHQPRHRVVARLRELEAEREQITHQSSLLQFQLDALSAQHELAQAKGRNNGGGANINVNGKLPESPIKSRRPSAPDCRHLRSNINESLEKLSVSSNGSGSAFDGSSMNEEVMSETGSPSPENHDSILEECTGSPENGSRNNSVNGSTDNGINLIGGSSSVEKDNFKHDSFTTHRSPINGSSGGHDRFSGYNSAGSTGYGSASEDLTDGSSSHRSRTGSDTFESPRAAKKGVNLRHSESMKEYRHQKTREASWEKYDTLKKRYEELKKKRAQRLHQGAVFVAQEDMSSSPSLQKHAAQNSCASEVDLERTTALVDY